jgi:predicted nucleic acid-binding protein
VIFVDTSFLIALLISTDHFHERALEISETINERKVINTTVLNETLNAFSGKGGKISKDLYNIILEMFDVEYLSPVDYEKAMDLFLHYDSSINYSDCTILTTMFQNNINRIVSFDRDFEKIEMINLIN